MEESNKNKSSYSGIIIFLIIFALVSLGVTYYIASNNLKPTLNQNIPNNIISGDEALNDVDDFGIKSYLDYYFINNLDIIEKTFTSGELVKETYWEYYPLVVDYIEITGLKNKVIEDKINKEIKEIAFKLGDEELDEYQNQRRVRCYTHANICDILSVELENHNNKKVGLNYDLTTGNQIKFEEVFTDSSNIKEIVQQSLYDMQMPYEPYDEIAFEWMYRFLNGKYCFTIDIDYISMYLDDAWYINNIHLDKYYKNIAVFNRYRTSESIFENEELKKVEYGFNEYENLYYVKDNVLIYLVDRGNNYSKIFEEYTFNNKKYPTSSDKTQLSVDEIRVNNIIEVVQNKILNVVEYSKNTPDTMHVLGINIDNFSLYSFKIECEKNKFHDSLEQTLINELKRAIFLFKYFYYENRYDLNIEDEVLSFDECYFYNNENEIYNYCFPNSNKKVLMKKDFIDYYDHEFYNLAYNEIFARHGHDFKNKDLRNEFIAKMWYLPTCGKTVSLEELNDIERQNVEILKNKIEQEKKYPKGFFELDEMLYRVDLGDNWKKIQFSYSDDENVIGEIYTPSSNYITYNEYLADSATSTSKKYFKGKYLHILLKGSNEIYQTIEIKNPFEGAMYNPKTQTIDLGENWGSFVYDINTGSGITSFVLTTQRIIKLSDLGEDVRSIRLYLPMNGACDKLIEIK